MSAHHPHDELLVSYAAGTLPETASVIVATHLALCPACRKSVSRAECIGEALIQDIAPVRMEALALDSTLARLDEEQPSTTVAPPVPSGDPLLPRPLRDLVPQGLQALKWKTLGGGFRYAALKADGAGRLGLLEGQPGKATPHHGHHGDEFTLVLSGGYTDELGAFARGDLQCGDSTLMHRQVVDAGAACLCLVLTRGGIRPSHPVLRLLARFLPF